MATNLPRDSPNIDSEGTRGGGDIMSSQQPYVTIRSRKPADGNSVSSADSTYGSSAGDGGPKAATHDISRVSYHVKHLGRFAQSLEDSASRAFPNRGRSSQRYKKVQALLLHWGSDDLFVLPELEDLERCLREDYAFDTEIFSIPSDNSHLELMMRVGKLIKEHEAQDTLFLIYYGGHARIDESRQSTWCATRHPDSPWLQWSAIQTLVERSASDVLILLDCCAGAASATFPTGNSITETISASSWDAIAPDPGRYSFTNALIEVMQQWRHRAFSAAMLHAEVLARLKHPRPITINGKHFEARSTPVHFMMTANHKAPSIEMSRIVPAEQRPPSPPQEMPSPQHDLTPDVGEVEAAQELVGGRGPGDIIASEPNENTPHVMISLALEEDQQLDLNAWEQWLSNFPAMAKYVKVQGVFKSHSNLLLLSMPVMVWDLLPEDHAISFVAFIRSNNLLAQKTQPQPPRIAAAVPQPQLNSTEPDSASFFSDTTYAPTETNSLLGQQLAGMRSQGRDAPGRLQIRSTPNVHGMGHWTAPGSAMTSPSSSPVRTTTRPLRSADSTTSLGTLQRQPTFSPQNPEAGISRTVIINQQKSSRRTISADMPEPPKFSKHIEARLLHYSQQDPMPTDAQKEFIASNLGIEPWHVEAWFHHWRQREVVARQLQAMKMDDNAPLARPGAQMILPGHLNRILELLPPSKVLLMDLRTASEFERSHIYGAINLRAPSKFIQDASFDMIERSFTDDQSRRKFAKWQAARCMVFYSKAVEYSWECPAADALFHKFKAWGWEGEVFVLKGHYREFSVSYNKYTVGNKMTQEAKGYVDSLQKQPSSKGNDALTQYEELLAEIENEGRVHPSTPTPTAGSDRTRTIEQQENDLEAEFQRRFPDLYRKAMDVQSSGEAPPAFEADWAGTSPGSNLKGKDRFDTKAGMVEYLDRGLSKIRDGQPLPKSQSTPGLSKLAAEGYFDTYAERPPSDDSYVKISKGDAQLASDPGFQKDGMKHADGEAESPGDETPRRGRGGFLNKVLRRT